MNVEQLWNLSLKNMFPLMLIVTDGGLRYIQGCKLSRKISSIKLISAIPRKIIHKINIKIFRKVVKNY